MEFTRRMDGRVERAFKRGAPASLPVLVRREFPACKPEACAADEADSPPATFLCWPLPVMVKLQAGSKHMLVLNGL